MRYRNILTLLMCLVFVFTPMSGYAKESGMTKGTTLLPEHYYTECPEQGTYQQFYDEAGDQMVNVYFPYGYNDSKYSKYDLYMMLHQAGKGNLSSWIETPCQSYGGELPPKQVYDWLIYEKKIPQILVMCINLELNVNNREDIRNAMHWAGDNLRTYAKNGTDEELAKARKHFFVGGLSMGAWKSDKCMREDYDIFANYIIGYGGDINYAASEIGKQYMKEHDGEYFIENLIILCGSEDVSFDDTKANYRAMAPVSHYSKYFRYGGGHGWAAAIPTMYDSLLFIYADYNDNVAACINKVANKIKFSMIQTFYTDNHTINENIISFGGSL